MLVKSLQHCIPGFTANCQNIVTNFRFLIVHGLVLVKVNSIKKWDYSCSTIASVICSSTELSLSVLIGASRFPLFNLSSGTKSSTALGTSAGISSSVGSPGVGIMTMGLGRLGRCGLWLFPWGFLGLCLWLAYHSLPCLFFFYYHINHLPILLCHQSDNCIVMN